MFTRGVKKKKRRRKLKRANLDFDNGDLVRFRSNPIHKKRRYTFLAKHRHSGKVLIFRKGKTERSQYYVLTDPRKIEKVKTTRRQKEAQTS